MKRKGNNKDMIAKKKDKKWYKNEIKEEIIYMDLLHCTPPICSLYNSNRLFVIFCKTMIIIF